MEFIWEDLPGNDALPVEIRGMAARAADLLPAIAGITESFRKTEMKRFDEQGPGWTKLADSTAVFKARYGFPAEILQRTQELMDSLTTNLTIEYFATSDGYFAEMGTNVPYAEFHQKGTPKMPKRPLIDLTPEVLLIWRTVLETYLVEGIELDIEAAL